MLRLPLLDTQAEALLLNVLLLLELKHAEAVKEADCECAAEREVIMLALAQLLWLPVALPEGDAREEAEAALLRL